MDNVAQMLQLSAEFHKRRRLAAERDAAARSAKDRPSSTVAPPVSLPAPVPSSPPATHSSAKGAVASFLTSSLSPSKPSPVVSSSQVPSPIISPLSAVSEAVVTATRASPDLELGRVDLNLSLGGKPPLGVIHLEDDSSVPSEASAHAGGSRVGIIQVEDSSPTSNPAHTAVTSQPPVSVSSLSAFIDDFLLGVSGASSATPDLPRAPLGHLPTSGEGLHPFPDFFDYGHSLDGFDNTGGQGRPFEQPPAFQPQQFVPPSTPVFNAYPGVPSFAGTAQQFPSSSFTNPYDELVRLCNVNLRHIFDRHDGASGDHGASSLGSSRVRSPAVKLLVVLARLGYLSLAALEDPAVAVFADDSYEYIRSVILSSGSASRSGPPPL